MRTAKVRGHLRRLVRRIRRHWPTTRITIGGDGHYCRPEVMDWCEANGIDYVFGLTGTNGLAATVEEVADAIRVERALEDRDVVRGFAETTHAAKSWKWQRRLVADQNSHKLALIWRFESDNCNQPQSASWREAAVLSSQQCQILPLTVKSVTLMVACRRQNWFRVGRSSVVLSIGARALWQCLAIKTLFQSPLSTV